MTTLTPPRPATHSGESRPTAATRAGAPRAGARHAGPAPGRDRSPAVLATLFGALAVLGGATALAPLIDGMSWWLPVAETVAVIWLVGVGSRLAGLPTWAAELAQLIALAIALTGMFTRSGIAGILPGPAVWRDGRAMVDAAWDQVMTTVPPTPVTAELTMFITITVGLLAFAVDLLIAGVRVPAMAAIPLLALYSVPASIAAELLPWHAFVIPAACYVGLLASSRSRQITTSTRASTALAASGAVIAVIAIGGAMLAGSAATGIGTDGRIPHSGHSGGEVGLSPWAMLRGELTSDDPVDVLTVHGAAGPAYLRTFALQKWIPGQGFGFGPRTADITDLAGAIPGAPATPEEVAVTITPLAYRSAYLPLYLRSTAVDGLGSGWDYDASLGMVFRTAAISPSVYTVTAGFAVPSAAELRADDIDPAAETTLTDVTGVPAEVIRLARTITAGEQTPFDKVNALLNYFTDPANGFSYSLSTPMGSSGDALVDFLTSKQGYCEQYAAAMTVLVRALGIPARVAIGFTQGAEQADGGYRISSTNAHAWVEVPFAAAGWISFDPTPSVNGQGGLQGFVADRPGTGGADDPVTESTAPSSTAAPSTTATQRPSAERSQTIPDIDGASPQQAATTSGFVRAHLRAILITGAGIIIAAVGLVAPSLLRAGRRRRRLARVMAGGSGAGATAWAEISDTAIDHGIVLAAAASARHHATALARAAQLNAAERDALRAVVTAAEQEWYAADRTGTTASAATLRTGVGSVINGLRRTRPLRWPARLWPRSLRRSARQ